MSWSSLEAAFLARDTDAFRAAVDALTTPVDEVLVHDRPMVCWVARHGWAEGLQALVDAGCRPERIPDALPAGIFPTYLTGPDVRALEVLIAAGADVNALGGSLSMTPLQYAPMCGDDARSEAITRLLLAHGADPHLCRAGGRPPLLIALEHPVPSTVRALLEAGVSPNCEDDQGDTPLRILLGELRAAIDRDEERNDGSAAIARDFVPKSIRALLDHGADATRTSSTGKPLMFYALAMNGCPPLVMEWLLDAGAPCDGTLGIGDEELDYLAMSALREVPASVATRLLDGGCPVDVAYEALGGTYLMEVARLQPAIALALWDHDPAFGEALVAARNEHDVHLLTYALIGAGDALSDDAITLVKRLLAAGLSPTATSRNGKTVLEMVEANNPSAVPLVKELIG